MPIHNNDISGILRKMADLLEIEGADKFRVRSYREAASSLENITDNLVEKVEKGYDLTKIPDVGDSIAEKIEEIVKTGSLQQLEEIKDRVPEDLSKLMNLEGIGPERAKELNQELGIETLDDLKRAVEDTEVREVEGFGKKVEDKIGQELKREKDQESRTSLAKAEEYADPLLDYLHECDTAGKIEIGGSYRRRKETVGDLDILITGSDVDAIMDHFTDFEDVKDVIKRGESRTSIRLKSGIRVDLGVISDKSYGAALLYFTGSKEHGIHLRERALDMNLKVNEYGVFPEGEDTPVASETEKEMYDALGLKWVPPEMREDRGEIDAAEKGNLPELITLDDIKGDIHIHTTYTDGDASVREMAEAAKEYGHDYIAITDHSKRVNVAGGLEADELAEELDEIEKINKEVDGIRILKGAEVDILKDGSLDLPDDVLEKLDICICSIHYNMDLPEDEQTNRILKAMGNPNLNILGHPSGRLIREREPMNLNMEKIIDKAAENGIILEINANPHRLDLNDRHCLSAKKKGVKMSISTDAHSTGELYNMKFGVYQARRGWLETIDVINTFDLDELLEHVERD